MADYVSQAMLAFTPGPPLALVANATGTLHRPDDSGYATPASVQLLDGSSVLTVTSTEYGFLPPMRLPEPVMVWKSGDYLVPVVTVQGLMEAAETAAAAAAAAAEAAAEASEHATAATPTQINAHLGGDAAGLLQRLVTKADLGSDGKVVPSQLPAGLAIVDASTSTKGAVQLAGDLGGTATSPTVPGLADKANLNQVVQLTGDQAVGGKKTFVAAPVVPDDSFSIGKVQGLMAALSASGAPTLENLPAGSHVAVYQASSGTWPGRPTSRTDITVLWVGYPGLTNTPAGAIAGADLYEMRLLP